MLRMIIRTPRRRTTTPLGPLGSQRPPDNEAPDNEVPDNDAPNRDHCNNVNVGMAKSAFAYANADQTFTDRPRIPARQ
eukprot:4516685-Pyramimonas_sp.AAC.1